MKFISLLCLLFYGVTGIGQSIHQHESWNRLLKAFVNDRGLVNYAGFKTKEAELDQYLFQLNQNYTPNLFTEAEKKAYLINAYNAYTIKLILTHYPVNSIKDIGSLIRSPFKIEFANLGNQRISLDDIEKKRLLNMDDPRIHFAINCASYSCPKLSNKAYVASRLEVQLEEATRDFINSTRNKLTPQHLELSKIFKWYQTDFENSAGHLINFLNQYSKTPIKRSASIDFLDYSWALNKQ